MKEFDITGMSCAACSARIEKAVSTVDGVEMVSVNLLTNSMAVDGSADNHDIINAVVNAGYGAEVKSDKPIKNTNKDALKDEQTPLLIKRLISSVVLLIPLMYVSMGHMMWGWWIPDSNYGNQSKIFYKRFQRFASQSSEYGYPCCAWLWSCLWL